MLGGGSYLHRNTLLVNFSPGVCTFMEYNVLFTDFSRLRRAPETREGGRSNAGRGDTETRGGGLFSARRHR